MMTSLYLMLGGCSEGGEQNQLMELYNDEMSNLLGDEFMVDEPNPSVNASPPANGVGMDDIGK